MYLTLRHRTWWAFHDIPPSLKEAMGGRKRLSKSLGTSDKREAKRRAQTLWILDWSKRIDEARKGSPSHIERDASFYRDLLRGAESEEERQAVLDQITDTATDRYQESLAKRGFKDEREVPDNVTIPELQESQRFVGIATGTLTPFLDHVSDWLVSLDNNEKTKDLKRTTITQFAKAFPYVQEVTRRKVQRWFEERAKLPTPRGTLPTTATLSRQRSELRSYWQYLHSLELVPDDDSSFDKLRIRGADSTDRKEFTPEEIAGLLKLAHEKGDEKLAQVIMLGMYTGARIESLCALRLSQIDLQRGAIRIEEDKTAAGKREVPIHSKLRPLLEKLATGKAEADYLLGYIPGNKYDSRSYTIGKRFGRLKSEVEFSSSYVFHSIRKTVATMLDNAGVPEGVAADILGHEKQTMTYGLYSGGTSLERKQKAIESLRYP